MTEPAVVRLLDLRGVACPLNYVKTRVALERIEPGQALEVWLDHGEPAESVPRSCDEDGFVVVRVEELEPPDEAPCVRVVVTARS